MRLLVALSAALALAAAEPQRRVRPQEQQGVQDQQAAEQNYNNYQQQDYRQEQQQYRQQEPQEFRQAKPVDDFRPKVKLETTTYIPIIHFDKQQGTDGSYQTSYETGNHIHAAETGRIKSVTDAENNVGSALVQTGSYSYTAPDGQVISVEYTADENGFRVSGDHIPTPPPVSPEIQAGLDLIYAGIKANQERIEHDFKNNPEAAKRNQERANLDYNGQYYQQ